MAANFLKSANGFRRLSTKRRQRQAARRSRLCSRFRAHNWRQRARLQSRVSTIVDDSSRRSARDRHLHSNDDCGRRQSALHSIYFRLSRWPPPSGLALCTTRRRHSHDAQSRRPPNGDARRQPIISDAALIGQRCRSNGATQHEARVYVRKPNCATKKQPTGESPARVTQKSARVASFGEERLQQRHSAFERDNCQLLDCEHPRLVATRKQKQTENAR